MRSAATPRARRLLAAGAGFGVLLALAGCEQPAPRPDAAAVATAPSTTESSAAATASPAPEETAASAAASSTGTPSATAPTPSAPPLAGRVIVIDPGHNGVWTRRELRKVPSGNGRTKPCNSSGTATNAGYAEHAYNWAQANALADVLRKRGAKVQLTRPNDRGEGPCVNLRSALANSEHADALVSIHADGSFAKGARGFHVIVSTTMAGGSRVESASERLAKAVRHALETGTGMPRSTYIGKGTALSFRTDLGTLNLSQRTAVMLEMGNMRNARDAALLGSATFRMQVADALADALQAELG